MLWRGKKRDLIKSRLYFKGVHVFAQRLRRWLVCFCETNWCDAEKTRKSSQLRGLNKRMFAFFQNQMNSYGISRWRTRCNFLNKYWVDWREILHKLYRSLSFYLWTNTICLNIFMVSTWCIIMILLIQWVVVTLSCLTFQSTPEVSLSSACSVIVTTLLASSAAVCCLRNRERTTSETGWDWLFVDRW